VGGRTGRPARGAGRRALHPDAINDHGLIVGYCSVAMETWLVFWRDGVLERLAVPSGVPSLVPEDLNEREVVVGLALRVDGSRFPFVWKDGVLTDLNSISDRQFERIAAINRPGQIAGEGPGPDGCGQGPFWADGRRPSSNRAVGANDLPTVAGHATIPQYEGLPTAVLWPGPASTHRTTSSARQARRGYGSA
jgi:uncharacterized membrane protein